MQARFGLHSFTIEHLNANAAKRQGLGEAQAGLGRQPEQATALQNRTKCITILQSLSVLVNSRKGGHFSLTREVVSGSRCLSKNHPGLLWQDKPGRLFFDERLHKNKGFSLEKSLLEVLLFVQLYPIRPEGMPGSDSDTQDYPAGKLIEYNNPICPFPW